MSLATGLIGRDMMCAIYSARLSFIYPQDYVSQEPSLKSIRWICASDTLHTYQFFKIQKGYIEALNFLIITS